MRDDDKRSIVFIAKKLIDLGFSLVATPGTHKVLRTNEIEAELVNKIGKKKLVYWILSGKGRYN